MVGRHGKDIKKCFQVFFVSLGWVLLMKNYTLESLCWFLKSLQIMAHDKLWTK